eukprot:TRINITY_DN6781_c0_g1_i1.p1 TRINITY_DN6781_c0_g1~~TRINITY_DN6781_c0_g1_i1.p1  ORF type:complete len:287 (+),score=18.73 TRINITY_DN6781_c0_g1_i1:145-1005(+)
MARMAAGSNDALRTSLLMAALIILKIADSAMATSFCDASGWSMVWRDEFESSLDNSSWTVDLAGNDSQVRDSLGTAENVWVANGNLVLRTQRESRGGYQYTSGSVQSQGKRSWRGVTRACVRARLPGVPGGSDGLWPAHWMMPDNHKCWPSNGEIDIMEMINGDGTTHGTYHWQVNGSCGDPHPSLGGSTSVASWASAYHEYAVEYSLTHMAWALDGIVFNSICTANVSSTGLPATFFDVPYYMILNSAIGGPWPNPVTNKTVLPAYHYIDYVRIAQPEVQELTIH